MARKNELDSAAVVRLEQEIAKVRLRLAQRIEVEEDRQEETTDASTKLGRLYRVFTLIHE